MATGLEAVGAASAILALVQATFQSSQFLYDKVRSWQTALPKVKALREQLKGLVEVLRSLKETALDAEELGALEQPLKACSELCQEYSAFIDANTTHTTDGKVSRRDWIKLEFKGKDITDYKDSLALWRSIIAIALADASLRTARLTNEELRLHRKITEDTAEQVQTSLSAIAEKLEELSHSDTEEKDALEAALKIINKALANAQPANVNIIDNNEASERGFHAFILSKDYILHATGNKVTDLATQLVGDVDAVTMQKALNIRLQAQLKEIENASMSSESKTGSIDARKKFQDQYGGGHKLNM